MKSRKHLSPIAAGLIVMLVTTLASTPSWALSPPPPQADDELLPLLYETLGGENWHNNEGWLDPEVHWCDWYGVTCSEPGTWGYYELEGIALFNNNLQGEISEELARLLFSTMAPSGWLQLNDNAISGSLPRFPEHTSNVNLSGNRFSGPLPEIGDQPITRVYRRRNFSRNQFSGTVPESWAQLDLADLDLADNQLDAGSIHAFQAISESRRAQLDLAGNRFEAELTQEIFAAYLNPRDVGNLGGGLNLCFNDFVITDPEVQQWVAERHAGGPDYEQCLGRDRVSIDAGLSGSWYKPGREGEGVSLMLLESGDPLLYAFTFDSLGRQHWLVGLGWRGERSLQWRGLMETRGHFGQGSSTMEKNRFPRSPARFRMDRTAADILHLQRNYLDYIGCDEDFDQSPSASDDGGGRPELLCGPTHFEDRMDYGPLSELAGTDCGYQSVFQKYSGAWYNPQRDGEGFIVEILPHQRALVYWYTYQPDGSGLQAWMTGTGQLEKTIVATPPPDTPVAWVEIDPLHQPTGTRYGPEFNPAEITTKDWGRLKIEFFENDSGRIEFSSDLEGYGAGEYPIERLAKPMLAECP